MKAFLDKYHDKITGTLSCFDRIIIKGYLPLGYGAAMEHLLDRQGILLKDFGTFAREQFERLKAHAQQLAGESGRPYRYLEGPERKDELARGIARAHGVREGLVCVLATVEPCRTFKIIRGKRRPRLVSARRKCLFLYYYFLEPDFGLIHVRIQTWFPFTIQVYLNGHEWLARRLDREGLDYFRADNAFSWLQDPQRTQQLADEFSARLRLPPLHRMATRVNPLLRDLLRDFDYQWVIDQAEYATDVMFRDRKALQSIYPQLLRHATIAFSAEDILRFFGHKGARRIRPTDTTDNKKMALGARIKHRMRGNWLKMYDKKGSVLRIETVINQPRHFRVRRLGTRKGQLVDGWFPMAKRITNLPRYAEVTRAANHRYLDALTIVAERTVEADLLHRAADPAARNGRRVRGFNPAAKVDGDIARAIMRGEHAIQGLRNIDVRKGLGLPCDKSDDARRASARVSRILLRLHAHGMIAKIPRSRRWRATKAGQAFLSLVIHLQEGQLAAVDEAA